MFSITVLRYRVTGLNSKTTCILNGALAPRFRSSLVEHMMAEPFSLAIDGSNDSGLQKKKESSTVRIFDINRSGVTTLSLVFTFFD